MLLANKVDFRNGSRREPRPSPTGLQRVARGAFRTSSDRVRGSKGLNSYIVLPCKGGKGVRTKIENMANVLKMRDM
jgi:hypothetical protein